MIYISTFSYFFPISLENLPYFRQILFYNFFIIKILDESFNSKENNETINVLGEFDLNRLNSLDFRMFLTDADFLHGITHENTVCEMLWK